MQFWFLPLYISSEVSSADECGVCKGTGKCAQCNGSGHDAEDPESIDCIDCSGTGECSGCKGSAKTMGWGRYLWESFCSLNFTQQRMLVTAVLGVSVATVLFWKAMVPLIAVAIAVVLYLRISRPKESL